MNFIEIKMELSKLSDIDWFDKLCYYLKKTSSPTAYKLNQLIGEDEINLNNEIRGSKFLVPFDNRFDKAFILPDVKYEPNDLLTYLGVSGRSFKLDLIDIIERFGEFKTYYNFYDENTQVFFYPIVDDYTFTGLSFLIDEENLDREEVSNSSSSRLTFYFGNNLYKGKYGYYMGDRSNDKLEN